MTNLSRQHILDYLAHIGAFGAHLRELKKVTKLGTGSILWHLQVLEDFDFIEKGAEVGAPKYMEWYGAFGLMVTLIWLYLEILRLLSKLRSRR